MRPAPLHSMFPVALQAPRGAGGPLDYNKSRAPIPQLSPFNDSGTATNIEVYVWTSKTGRPSFKSEM